MQLANTLTSIQRGRAEDREGWCWEITGFPSQTEAGDENAQLTSASWSGLKWDLISPIKMLLPVAGLLGLHQGISTDLRRFWK